MEYPILNLLEEYADKLSEVGTKNITLILPRYSFDKFKVELQNYLSCCYAIDSFDSSIVYSTSGFKFTIYSESINENINDISHELYKKIIK